jgi:hypothetical protein
MAEALIEAFGLDEVGQWRWFVGTEMENRNWWEAEDGSAESTLREFCRLYDWSVFALDQALGDGRAQVGSHAMMHGAGFWDPAQFIAHCRTGQNDATATTGTRLDFFAISCYDRAPGPLVSDEANSGSTGNGGDLAGFGRLAARARTALDQNGFTTVPVEVSEGGILFGTDGKWLWHGLCPGGSYDASWTALAFWNMLEAGTVRWSRWPLVRTGGLFHGPEAPATHAVRMISELSSDIRLPVRSVDEMPFVHAVAGWDPRKRRLHLLAFHHAVDIDRPDPPAPVEFQVNGLPFEGPVTVRRRTVSPEQGDFWPEWCKDREAAGIGDDAYLHSRDQLDVAHTLKDPAHVAIWRQREATYAALAAYPAATTEAGEVHEGAIRLGASLPCFSVSLIEIELE